MDSGSVEGYFAKLPPDKRAGLMQLRRTLKTLLPKAEECISYGMPAFRHPDGVVVYYAAMKAHLSFFPTSYPIEACAEDLREYQTSKGTIRFPIDTPLPVALVKKLVRVRLEQMAGESAARPTKRASARRKSGFPGRTRTGTSPKSTLNAAWHQAHRMPRNAKPAERAAWHVAHAKACGCREMPASVSAWLKGRKPVGD
jgi:uncharacterized protein YdhG (YjbR/CyaY superfamily)